MRSRPGANAQAVGDALTIKQQDANACDGENESGKDEGPLGKPLSETFCGK